MPNRITGSTDTSGALTVIQKMPKSIILIGERKTEIGEVPFVTNPETIFDIFGTLDAKGYFGSKSPMVEMAKILITNGVSYIKGMLVDGYGAGKTYTSVAEAYEGAFAKTLVDTTVKCIVLDNNTAAILSKLKTHLTVAEAEDMFRYATFGAPVGTSNINASTLATGINHRRMFMAFPNVVDDNNIEKDGIYTACGLASVIMTETSDPALPMNGVQILGYGGVSKTILRSEKEALVVAGITPLYTSNGYPTIHRLVTTATKDTQGNPDIIWQEGTTLFIADDVLESVENKLKANYKRTKNVARILDSIRTDVIGVLEAKNEMEIIQEFNKNTVSVIKDPTDLYGALVDYEFKVVTPLYTITIKQHMKL